MIYRRLLAVLMLVVAMFSCIMPREKTEEKLQPNIVFILADDLGYGDVGCFGQKDIPTPNIDRLAAEGMTMLNFYSGSNVCAPSRCCLLTGKHTGHSSIRSNRFYSGIGTTPLDSADITIAEALDKNPEYVTGICGRWHLGGEKSNQKPLDNGFDYHFGKLSSLMRNRHGVMIDSLFDAEGKHISEELYFKKGIEPMYENGEYYTLEEKFMKNRPLNMDEMVTQKSIDFIERNKDEPFFLYVPFSLVHSPIEFQEKTPASENDWPELESDFASMVQNMDRLVGEIAKAVDTMGLAENTIIIFSSDNGPHMEGGHNADFFNSNGKYKGYKRDLYEGGIKMPTVIRWTGKLKPGSASSHQAAFWDILPTACDVAGVEPPAGIDGISFLPLLEGKEQKEHEYLYWEAKGFSFVKNAVGRSRALRKGDWKLIQFLDQESIELYNLTNDPEELLNIADKHSEVVNELMGIMDEAHIPSKRFPFFDSEFEQ